MTGRITDIERYAINDGFGVRTTIFLKGCPMRCRWCSNPETQKFYPEMVFFGDKCISCGLCQSACSYGALDHGLESRRTICDTCWQNKVPFVCTYNCYPQCRKIVGEEKTTDQILDIVKRDIPFYERSGGGVTISGGEPFSQPAFLLDLLKKLKNNWIHTAVETCGTGQTADYEKTVPYLDLIFIDLKSTNPQKHMDWTRMDNTQILKNIIRLDELAPHYGYDLFIRTPVIPGFNDSETEITNIARFVSSHCHYYKGMELLPYHKLGRGKYMSLGREYILKDLQSPDSRQMQNFQEILNDNGIEVYEF